MTSDYPESAAIDLTMVLIAELMRDGLLDAQNVASMMRRLRLSDLPDLADRLQGLHLSNQIDAPDQVRDSLHVVDSSDGGNTGE
jgi:hypothetical protein